jgi:hypothetical protein
MPYVMCAIIFAHHMLSYYLLFTRLSITRIFYSTYTYTLPAQITAAPPGAQACTLDIKQFHRTCSVIPSHKPWLVLQGAPGQFYIDHDHPFGAACASSNAGMIANALVDIWEGEGVGPIAKYEDDLNIFRIPSTEGQFTEGEFRYDYDRAEMLRRVSSLGIPWHEEKGDGHFKFQTVFIGFLWDIPQKRVSLPETKRLKFLERVRLFLHRFSKKPCHLLDVEKIHGSLCHVTFIYLEGRSHLPSLSNFAASFRGDEYQTRHPSHSMLTDLRWWWERLSLPCTTRLLKPIGPLRDIGIFVDASTSWGIGIFIGDEWAAFRLSPSWKVEGRDICWLETVAIELLSSFLESKGFHDAHLLIHSDNQGTIGALEKGRSRNIYINLSVRRTHLILTALSITPRLVYIESQANPADPISRGEPGPSGKRIFLTSALPDELLDCFVNA